MRISYYSETDNANTKTELSKLTLSQIPPTNPS